MTVRTISRGQLKFSFASEAEFENVYDAMFWRRECWFTPATETPFIIDAGAHIGVSVLFFKQLYPAARVLAFEPNPVTFRLLKRNVEQNGLRGVTLVNAALGTHDGLAGLQVRRHDPNASAWYDTIVRHDWHTESEFRTVRVPCRRLSTFLTEPVDLLKLDIEGMERAVLEEAASRLPLVEQLIVELHGSRTNSYNQPEPMLDLLDHCGFSYTLEQNLQPITLRQCERPDYYWLLIRARQRRDALAYLRPGDRRPSLAATEDTSGYHADAAGTKVS